MGNGQIEVARRDTGEKKTVAIDECADIVAKLMEEIQENIYSKALKLREDNLHVVDDYKTFKTMIEEKSGFYAVHWDGTVETEEKIKEETKATIRCLPLEGYNEEGKCMVTGKPSKQRVIMAKAY